MTYLNSHRVGVCSWSLRAASAMELAGRVKAMGLHAVQLALDPIRTGRPGWGEIETVNALRSHGIAVLSGMMAMAGEDYSTLESIKLTGGVRQQATWGENLRAAQENARLARRLGVGLVTFHAGFIPHAAGEDRREMIERLRMMIDHFDDCGVRVAFETGQERAETLQEALEELRRPYAAVNFDPANMILYGMGDPVAALKLLAPRVIQIHIKDAVPSGKVGEWGRETRAGDGEVDWKRFFETVLARGLAADLVIEREGGEGRDSDIAAARDLLTRHGFGRDTGGGSIGVSRHE